MSQSEMRFDGPEQHSQEECNNPEQTTEQQLKTIEPEDIETWSKLRFRDEVDAYKFYVAYAFRHGFTVRIRGRLYRKSRPRAIIVPHYNRYVCSKEGFSEKSKQNAVVVKKVETKKIEVGYENLRQRKESRCGCTAYMVVKLFDKEDMYLIIEWEVKHYGHESVPGSLAHFIPSNRRVNLEEGLLAELNESVGVKLNTSYRLICRGAGGVQNVGCLKVDLKNQLRTSRKNKIGSEEGVCVQQHLMKTARDNPDHRMRVDYSLFGDAITFDTTYRTNRTCRPLGLVVGFNHHRQIIIFGSALLFDKTIPSFEWLFRTFIRCMNNISPETMFTDQDQAMAATMKSSLPRVKHNLCTWHILQNAKSNLHNSLLQPVTKVLSYLMYHVESEEEFDSVWSKMLATNFIEGQQLRGFIKSKSWLLKLAEKREQWCNAWVVQPFTAGMRSYQASESINSIDRLFLKADQQLSDFFPHFADMMDNVREKEDQKEFECLDKQPINNFKKCPIVCKATAVYTPTVLAWFHEEREHCLEYTIYRKPDADQTGVSAWKLNRLDEREA